MSELLAIVTYSESIAVHEFLDRATGKTHARVVWQGEPLPEQYDNTIDAMKAAKALKRQQPGQPGPQIESEMLSHGM